MTGSEIQGIFISYRREDSAGHAGRLFDRLRAHFGKGSVFMDVEGIEAGVDFVETIEQAVGGCEVLLAIIGRGWLESRDRDGRRRLDDTQDFIRLETAAALARKVRVIPVLVEGAQMPAEESLPAELRPLTRRQAVELRDSRWEDDIQALIRVLERVLKPGTAGATDTKDDWRDRLAWARKAGPAALLLGAAVIGGTLISQRWGSDEGDGVRQAAPVAQVETAPALKSDTPPVVEIPQLAAEKRTVEKPVLEKPAVQAPATEKPVIAKPKATPAPVPIAAVQPVAEPPVVAALQPQPKAVTPPAAPVAPPPPPRKIAVIALGEPTYRDFWEGERRAAYSTKVAGLYRDSLREVASGRVDFSLDLDPARDLRGLEKALREAPGLCAGAQASAVFAARVEEPQSISRTESAYWPELRLTAIACDSGKQYSVRETLSPRRDDGFPFERNMTETMEKFAREYRHLLQ